MLKKLCYLILVVVFFSAFNTNDKTFADNNSGVNISVSTDRNSYEIGDSVNVTIKLENTTNFPRVVDLPQNDIPEWLKLNAGNVFPLTLKAKETVEKTIIGEVVPAFEQWATVTLDGKEIKVGVRAIAGVIEPGSKFGVEVLNKGTPAFNEALKQLDSKNDIERLGFLNLGVKKADGTPYSTFSGYITVYVQIPDGWDGNELQAIYVSPGTDEQFTERVVTIGGVKYLCFNTNHCSPYAIVDPVPKTGDTCEWAMVSTLIISAAVVIMLAIHKKNAIKSLLVLMVGVLLVLPLSVQKAFADEVNVSVSTELYKYTLKNSVTVGSNTRRLDVKISIEGYIADVNLINDGLGIVESVPDGWNGNVVIEEENGSEKKEIPLPASVDTNVFVNLEPGAYNIVLVNEDGTTMDLESFEFDDYGV